MSFTTLNKMFNRSVVYMCGGGASAPPPPPPPAPEPAAPINFGAKTDAAEAALGKRVGKKKLQIPLTQAGGATGLGIPTP